MKNSIARRSYTFRASVASRSTVIRYYGDGASGVRLTRRVVRRIRSYLHNPVHALVHSRECSIQRRSRARAPRLLLPLRRRTALPFTTAAYNCTPSNNNKADPRETHTSGEEGHDDKWAQRVIIADVFCINNLAGASHRRIDQ